MEAHSRTSLRAVLTHDSNALADPIARMQHDHGAVEEPAQHLDVESAAVTDLYWPLARSAAFDLSPLYAGVVLRLGMLAVFHLFGPIGTVILPL